ncbi:MFS general substrate transporter [Fomes fomentarius]|nr:MFS general substrate transporter [Fomes fomentarius]
MDDKLARHDTTKGSECAFGDAHSAAPKSTLSEHPMDGGRAAWLTVLGGWLVAFSTFGAGSSFGVYQDFYTHQGTAGSSNISWIGSLQFFLMFATGLPAGKMLDSGYFHHAQITGAALYILSLFMLSLADTGEYYQLILSQGLGVGLGCGLIFSPALSVQAHHWKRRRALAMGVVLSGTSCGGVVYPIMLNSLMNSSVGFAWGVRAQAFLTLGLLLVANMTMTTRTDSIKSAAAAKKELSRTHLLQDYPYWISVAGAVLTLLGLYIPFFYLQLFVGLHGLSPTLAFYSVAVLNAASFFGRTILNFLADQYGRFNIACPTAFITSGLVFLMFRATTVGGTIAFAILYGFFSGGCEVRIGIGFFATGFGVLLGAPIAGALIDPGFRWYRLIVFSGTVMAAGSVLLLVARQMAVKRRGTQRT